MGAGGASCVSGVATGAAGAAAGALQPAAGAELQAFLQQEPRSHAEALLVDEIANEPARIAEVMSLIMIRNLSSQCRTTFAGHPCFEKFKSERTVVLAFARGKLPAP